MNTNDPRRDQQDSTLNRQQRDVPRPPPEADAANRSDRGRDAHVDAFEKRSRPPGEAGLANEARPGLGTRADEKSETPAAPKRTESEGEPRAVEAARMYHPPRPDPQEQNPDSMAQEYQRSTGVSGHMGGT